MAKIIYNKQNNKMYSIKTESNKIGGVIIRVIYKDIIITTFTVQLNLNADKTPTFGEGYVYNSSKLNTLIECINNNINYSFDFEVQEDIKYFGIIYTCPVIMFNLTHENTSMNSVINIDSNKENIINDLIEMKKVLDDEVKLKLDTYNNIIEESIVT